MGYEFVSGYTDKDGRWITRLGLGFINGELNEDFDLLNHLQDQVEAEKRRAKWPIRLFKY